MFFICRIIILFSCINEIILFCLSDNLFPSSSREDSPIQMFPTKQKIECPYCHKTFPYPCYLECHIRIHTGERPFVCQICQKTFVQLGNLKQHELVHTGKKPFQCPTCEYSTTHSLRLKMHMVRQHQMK